VDERLQAFRDFHRVALRGTSQRRICA